MLKKICHNGWLPLMILFVFGSMTVTDRLKFIIGNDETTLFLVLFLLFSFIVAFFQFAKEYSKYLIGVYIFYFALFFLILGYSSLPDQIVERARDHYAQFENIDLSSIKKDDLHPIRINYVNREQKARQLELEAAELRYYGPNEYYGFETWQCILFFSTVGLLISYALCWFFYISRSNLTHKGSDIVYSLVAKEFKGIYQACFEYIISKTDIENETKRTKGHVYNKDKSKVDWDKQISIVSFFEQTTGLKGIVVQTMVEQFYWADEFQREIDKKCWIDRVMNRKKLDWFPDSNFIFHEVMGVVLN